MKSYPTKQTITFFILTILIILCPAITFADADTIFKENNKAVVVIMTFDKEGKPISQGSGFIIKEDGVIVTNDHVISNAVDIKVKADDKILDVDRLIHQDKENDIVILKAKAVKLPIVKLGDFKKANIGEKIYVISNPKGLENTIYEGIVGGIREISSEKKVLLITAPISSGSSGSPVFNQNGNVIGIATFLLAESKTLNFAMPVNLIKDKINIKKVSTISDSEIEDNKKTAAYWFNLGFEYLELGNYKEAIGFFKQAIRINPDFAKAHYNLGVAYVNFNMHKEAIESFKQAIRINPDNAEAYYSLALSYLMLNDKNSAVDEYKVLKELDKEKANKLFNMIFK
jgi:tetratricopeptide (TPR) repeat protein